MAYRQFLILVFSLLSGSAFAGYAQLAAPVAWAAATNTATTGVSQFVYKVAANDAVMFGRTVLTDAALSVGGRAVVVPAALRFAANAPAIAARAMYLNPGLAIGIGVAGALASYYAVGGFEPQPAGWVKREGGIVCAAPSTCYMYQEQGGYNWPAGAWVYTDQQAASSLIGHQLCPSHCGTVTEAVLQSGGGTASPYYKFTVYVNSYWGTEYITLLVTSKVVPPYDTSSLRPATPQEFENYPWPQEFPPGVPAAIPVPLPVEVPVVNPEPLIAPPPAPAVYPSPRPQPMRVPMGDPVPVPLPVPNPDNLPQTWKSPVVDIVPSPTANEPWRVDVQPKDVVKEDAAPLPEKAPVPLTPPVDEKVTPKEDTPGLCDLFPDILACAKLGDAPAPETLQTQQKDISVAADSGWGGSGACPAPRQFVMSGKSFELPFTMVCDFMTGIKPVFIAAAFLAAALILIGRKGGEA